MSEIILNHVSKVFKNTTVIDDVNFTIPHNSIFGLKGINGSGKTMIMRLISGLIYPNSGEIKINGKIIGKDIDFPKSLGMMLENPTFFNRYNGYDNLRIISDIKGKISEKEIDKTMEKVGLAENGKKKYRKFSLGMKQRLGIAAAIMENPDILILDEPTNSLDESGVEMVKQIVLEAKDKGTTVIISCHDSTFLDTVCDQVAVLVNGKVTDIYQPKEQENEL